MRYSVSKAIIVVERDVGSHCLMSVKRDPGRDNDGKLEFLGGRIESAESPLEALLRELSEEEATGNLSDIAQRRDILHAEHQIGDAMHCLFPMGISFEEYSGLIFHPDESYGFRLVGTTDLTPCIDKFTHKTNMILPLLNLSVNP